MSSSCCVFPLEVTLALLDAANDKDSKVQEQVRKSMLTLGKQQPDRVLAMCQDYLLKHSKVKLQHTPLQHILQHGKVSHVKVSIKTYLANLERLLLSGFLLHVTKQRSNSSCSPCDKSQKNVPN